MLRDVNYIGKIPSEYRFDYIRTLSRYESCKDEKDKNQLFLKLKNIVKHILKDMNIINKIDSPDSAEDWRCIIDDDYNVILLSMEYIKRNFKEKEKE